MTSTCTIRCPTFHRARQTSASTPAPIRRLENGIFSPLDSAVETDNDGRPIRLAGADEQQEDAPPQLTWPVGATVVPEQNGRFSDDEENGETNQQHQQQTKSARSQHSQQDDDDTSSQTGNGGTERTLYHLVITTTHGYERTIYRRWSHILLFDQQWGILYPALHDTYKLQQPTAKDKLSSLFVGKLQRQKGRMKAIEDYFQGILPIICLRPFLAHFLDVTTAVLAGTAGAIGALSPATPSSIPALKAYRDTLNPPPSSYAAAGGSPNSSLKVDGGELALLAMGLLSPQSPQPVMSSPDSARSEYETYFAELSPQPAAIQNGFVLGLPPSPLLQKSASEASLTSPRDERRHGNTDTANAHALKTRQQFFESNRKVFEKLKPKLMVDTKGEVERVLKERESREIGVKSPNGEYLVPIQASLLNGTEGNSSGKSYNMNQHHHRRSVPTLDAAALFLPSYAQQMDHISNQMNQQQQNKKQHMTSQTAPASRNLSRQTSVSNFNSQEAALSRASTTAQNSASNSALSSRVSSVGSSKSSSAYPSKRSSMILVQPPIQIEGESSDSDDSSDDDRDQADKTSKPEYEVHASNGVVDYSKLWKPNHNSNNTNLSIHDQHSRDSSISSLPPPPQPTVFQRSHSPASHGVPSRATIMSTPPAAAVEPLALLLKDGRSIGAFVPIMLQPGVWHARDGEGNEVFFRSAASLNSNGASRSVTRNGSLQSSPSLSPFPSSARSVSPFPSSSPSLSASPVVLNATDWAITPPPLGLGMSDTAPDVRPGLSRSNSGSTNGNMGHPPLPRRGTIYRKAIGKYASLPGPITIGGMTTMGNAQNGAAIGKKHGYATMPTGLSQMEIAALQAAALSDNNLDTPSSSNLSPRSKRRLQSLSAPRTSQAQAQLLYGTSKLQNFLSSENGSGGRSSNSVTNDFQRQNSYTSRLSAHESVVPEENPNEILSPTESTHQQQKHKRQYSAARLYVPTSRRGSLSSASHTRNSSTSSIASHTSADGSATSRPTSGRSSPHLEQQQQQSSTAKIPSSRRGSLVMLRNQQQHSRQNSKELMMKGDETKIAESTTESQQQQQQPRHKVTTGMGSILSRRFSTPSLSMIPPFDPSTYRANDSQQRQKPKSTRRQASVGSFTNLKLASMNEFRNTLLAGITSAASANSGKSSSARHSRGGSLNFHHYQQQPQYRGSNNHSRNGSGISSPNVSSPKFHDEQEE